MFFFFPRRQHDHAQPQVQSAGDEGQLQDQALAIYQPG